MLKRKFDSEKEVFSNSEHFNFSNPFLNYNKRHKFDTQPINNKYTEKKNLEKIFILENHCKNLNSKIIYLDNHSKILNSKIFNLS